MRYLSVCSGIEAATVAWQPLGWRPAAFSEIEAFPSAVLAHHYPDVPNLGDMTNFRSWPDAAIDLLVGGTPCQSFSVAGLRKGLDDPRGNLALTYLAIAERYRPRWLVWENVPGVLSSNGGRDFGAFLGWLAELGYGWAYRVLDAQYFGVAQRRRRVFVVGCLGDWRAAAAVLFERDCLSGHPAPRREAGEEPARCLTRGADSGSRYDGETENFVAHTLRGEGFDASEDGTGRGTPLVPVAFGWQNSPSQGDSVSKHVSPTLDKSKTPAVAHTLTACGGQGGRDKLPVTAQGSAVRRLTPRECERLQGFPDDYTLIPWRGKPAGLCPDGPRYKALGNSMAVPVMRWIGEQIGRVQAITGERAAA